MRAWRSLDIGDKVRFKTRDDSPGLLCTVIEKGETHVLVESDLNGITCWLDDDNREMFRRDRNERG